jgi:hypothetical protein
MESDDRMCTETKTRCANTDGVLNVDRELRRLLKKWEEKTVWQTLFEKGDEWRIIVDKSDLPASVLQKYFEFCGWDARFDRYIATLISCHTWYGISGKRGRDGGAPSPLTPVQKDCKRLFRYCQAAKSQRNEHVDHFTTRKLGAFASRTDPELVTLILSLRMQPGASECAIVSNIIETCFGGTTTSLHEQNDKAAYLNNLPWPLRIDGSCFGPSESQTKAHKRNHVIWRLLIYRIKRVATWSEIKKLIDAAEL